jgi:hypothetical protein
MRLQLSVQPERSHRASLRLLIYLLTILKVSGNLKRAAHSSGPPFFFIAQDL